MNRPASFRLLDDLQASYIKYNGREPRTLEELAIALANNEHSRRLAEVKSMRARLALLDKCLPALAERGIKLWARDIHAHDRGKTLRIYGPMMGADDKLHAALLDLGFKEVERQDTVLRTDTVTLKHGRWLAVTIDVSKPAAPAADNNPPAGA